MSTIQACKGKSGLDRCKCSSSSRNAFWESEMLAAQLAAANKSKDDQKGSSESSGKCGTLELHETHFRLRDLPPTVEPIEGKRQSKRTTKQKRPISIKACHTFSPNRTSDLPYHQNSKRHSAADATEPRLVFSEPVGAHEWGARHATGILPAAAGETCSQPAWRSPWGPGRAILAMSPSRFHWHPDASRLG